MRSVLEASLREHRRAFGFWAAGILALCAYTLSVYPSVRDSAGYQDLVDQLPESLRALFAATGDISSPAGYLTIEIFSAMAPALFLVVAIAYGAGAIAGEEERRTIDLLLANPRSRSRVVAEKAGALAIYVLALGVVLGAGLVTCAAIFDVGVPVARLAGSCLLLALLAILFGEVALLVGCATGRRGTAIGMATAAAVVSYVVWSLAPLAGWLAPYRRLSPYDAYLGGDPLRAGIDPLHVLALAAAALVAAALAARVFERRDLAA